MSNPCSHKALVTHLWPLWEQNGSSRGFLSPVKNTHYVHLQIVHIVAKGLRISSQDLRLTILPLDHDLLTLLIKNGSGNMLESGTHFWFTKILLLHPREVMRNVGVIKCPRRISSLRKDLGRVQSPAHLLFLDFPQPIRNLLLTIRKCLIFVSIKWKMFQF